MKKIIAVMFVSVLFCAVGARAIAFQEKPAAKAPPSVLGKWSLQADTPHGKMTIALELKVDAKDSKKLAGTMASDMMGELPLTGEYVDSRLTFKAASGGGELTFAGKLKDADTLTGVLSSPNHDVAAVATRVVVK